MARLTSLTLALVFVFSLLLISCGEDSPGPPSGPRQSYSNSASFSAATGTMTNGNVKLDFSFGASVLKSGNLSD